MVIELLILASVIYISISLIIFFNGFRAKKNQLVSAAILSLGLWILVAALTHLPTAYILFLLLFTRLSFFFSLLGLSILLLLSKELYINRNKWDKFDIIYLLPIILIGIPLVLTKIFVLRLQYIHGLQVYDLSNAIYVVIILALSYFALIIYYLSRGYFTLKGIYLLQIRYILGGITLSVLATLSAGLVLPLLGFPYLEDWVPLASIFLIGFMAYSILKHRFLDIRIVIGQFVRYLLLTIFIYVFYYLILGVQNTFLGGAYSHTSYLLGISFTIFFILIYEIFQRHLSKIKIISRRERLVGIGNELSLSIENEVDMETLCKDVNKYLNMNLNIQFVAFYILPINFLYNVETHLQISSNLLAEISHQFNDLVIVDEYFINLDKDPDAYNAKQKDLLKVLRLSHIAFYIPLFNRDNSFFAGLFISDKNSKEGYSSQEIQIIRSITNQINIAIQRSILYIQLKDANKNLEVRVTKATGELKIKNDELRQAYEAAESTAKQERDMLDIMGHELRTPATVVKMATYLLDSKVKDEYEKKQIIRIKDSIERQIRLINTFINSAKLENNKIELALSPIDLNKMLQEAVEDHQNEAIEKGLTLSFKAYQNIGIVIADSARIREVIDNLITNAIKYTQEGSVTVKDYIQDNEIVVSVADTGEGIEEKDKEELFQKFKRLKNYTATSDGKNIPIIRPGGTGLGLYVSKGVIEMHKGRIWVESRLGKGSTFSFALAKPTQEQIDTYKEGNQKTANLFNKLNLS